MLHVFVGNDAVVVRTDAHAFLDAQEGDMTRVTADTFDPETLETLLYGQSLFGEVFGPVVLDFLSESDGALEKIEARLSEYATSARVFVVIDKKPKVAREKLFRAHATTYEESDERPSTEGFNTFALADALLKRDKKLLWMLLMRARSAGVSPEEITGTLFWQLKSLWLASTTQSAEDAGMKDYPYKKAKGALRLFPGKDIATLTESLLELYHKGHAGSDMDIALERWVLRV